METLNQSLIDCGVATLTLPGQAESGDRYTVKAIPDRILVGVVDGLGHGYEAAAAARTATRTLEEHAEESVIALLNRCHDQLRQTRGVVMDIATLNTREGTLTWLGVGNVEGILYRADPLAKPPREFLLLRSGVVGGKFERPFASIVPIAPGDTLVFLTDGINSHSTLGIDSGRFLTDPPQQIAERILSRYAKGTDDALALVARYKGC